MEPITTQVTHFDVEVFPRFGGKSQVSQSFLGWLVIFAVPTYIVICRSTAPSWLIVTAVIMTLASIVAFYKVAKNMFTRSGYKLVRDELKTLFRHQLHVTSFEDNGHFTAVQMSPSIQKVHGVIVLIESDEDGLFLKYRIHLFPE